MFHATPTLRYARFGLRVTLHTPLLYLRVRRSRMSLWRESTII